MFSYHPTATDARGATRGFKTSFSLPSVITKYIWGGIVWAGGHRKEANYQMSDWAVLDFDDGQLSLRQAVQTFCDCIHVIGTTKSHGRNKGGVVADRFRVAIPWQSRITDVKTYRYNMELLTKKYPVDAQCIDGARLFFPCVEIVSSSTDGYKQDVSERPANYGLVAPIRTNVIGTGHIPRHLALWLSRPAAAGSIKSTYFKIGAELHRWGFTLDKAIAMVAASPVGANATAADPERELHECVRSGWHKDNNTQG